MKVRLRQTLTFLLFAFIGVQAEDWPTWRHDAGRTGATLEALPVSLHLQWTLKLPPLVPAYKDSRLQFDKGYEPIVTNGKLIIGSSWTDSVTAYDAATGEQAWRFLTEGPIRFAPTAMDDRVFVGSDDGFLYCIQTDTGKLLWKFRGVPSTRKVLGNGRMISLWPVRGGPVAKEGKVWFAAGVWPMEGVYVYCLDAKTGKLIWLNDRCGFMYGTQPHNAQATGGLAPQGYLLLDGDDLIVPSSVAFPARFNAATGKLKEFELPSQGRLPGGWFASTASEKEKQRLQRRGLLFDSDVNKRRHEDRVNESGQPGVRSTIYAGDRTISFSDGVEGVSGEIYEMLTANGRLYVITLGGEIHCLSAAKVTPRVYQFDPKGKPSGVQDSLVAAILDATEFRQGYGLILGMTEKWMGLVENSSARLVGVGRVGDMQRLREQINVAGVTADRVGLFGGNPLALGFPRYFAGLVLADESADIKWNKELWSKVYSTLRPYGGSLCIVGSRKFRNAFRTVFKLSEFPAARLSEHNGFTLLQKEGALPGATNYLGKWEKSSDENVRFPLGVLWFGDELGHFKRSPQPKFVDGVMVSTPKNWMENQNERTRNSDYRLLPAVLSDVFTGRVMGSNEEIEVRKRHGKVDLENLQPSQYRPPHQANAWKPEQPRAGERFNPLTGEREPRVFPKSYGCDGGVDYGYLYTMRSATASYYDKRIESGTINLSGPRSGCTNSIIPANGVLSVPYYYEGCTCSYPLPMAMAMVSMPQTHEQWTSWGEVPPERLNGKLRRLGLNFGAPGDRATESGTLWIDSPSVGGPSPILPIKVLPEGAIYRYHHSLRVEGGRGWPWVAASLSEGIESVRIQGFSKGKYLLRLTFLEPDPLQSGERMFDVLVQGKKLLSKYDVVKAAGGAMRSTVESFGGISIDDSILIKFRAIEGAALLSGLELIREDLPSEQPVKLADREVRYGPAE
ncbi:MAG: PQQ-binding-like beta-propeller repeat protein [Verrucomicrobia bacterium]|nr:PQQ-binding-like beta-propeller repeat protein [Verrucomicrobiota bacterium]MDA1047047.1 PQQ-binding-like beta-propeller repeat protein [Verrucomicrobiota bacterium]